MYGGARLQPKAAVISENEFKGGSEIVVEKSKRMIVTVGASTIFALAVAGMWWYKAGYPVYQAQEAVRAKLNDPASAQFRNVTQTVGGPFCGEVNAKNRMGGYVGFRWFDAFPMNDGKWHVSIDEDTFGGLAKDLCETVFTKS